MLNQSGDLEQHSLDGVKIFGTVVDNQDPLKLQRIRVKIPFLLEGEVDSLPWLAPMHRPGVGTDSSGQCIVEVPPLGARVVVEFQKGDLNYGLVVGQIASADVPVSSELLKNYPNRRGYQDAAGNLFLYDSTDGAKVVQFVHSSGTLFLISDDGSVDVVSSGSANRIKLLNGSSSITLLKNNIKLSSPRIDLN